MIINYIPEDAQNVLDYEINARTGKITLGDDELDINLKKRERDDPVPLDICIDYLGNLTIGVSKDAQTYAAQILIPAREYTEEGEGEEAQLVPVPFDIDKCTLTLWELEE
jgi:hypothetical protein